MPNPQTRPQPRFPRERTPMASLPPTHPIELAKTLRRSMEVVSLTPRLYRDHCTRLTDPLDRLLRDPSQDTISVQQVAAAKGEDE